MPTWSALSLQDSSSPLMYQLIYFHDFTIIILTLITTLVGLNILFICLFKLTNRYLLQEQIIEITWTVLPIFILLAIAFPSLQLLYLLDDPFSPSLTIKTLGHQWYWSYEYSDFPNIEFDSYIIPSSPEIITNQRLLDVDNNIILPTYTQIRIIVSARDVIHAWTVPALGVKVDAVPGRLNQLIFSINRTGLFSGQCSEICGANHRFIPIKVEAIPIKNFLKWISKFNSLDGW